MLPTPKAGILQAVHGTAQALAVEGITDLDITVPLGRRVWPLPEADRYLGFLFGRGPTPEAVEQALRRSFSHLDIVID